MGIKTLMLALFGLALAYALLVAAIALGQQRLLYLPMRAPAADLTRGPWLRPWPSERDFRGLVAEPDGPARATAIVFHGNAGHAGHRAWYADALTRHGLRVVLAEYPGYGPRQGALGEASLVRDAAESIVLAHVRHGAPLLVIGESLGAGVAAHAAARERERVAGLMLVTPWSRLVDVAGHHYPWLPVAWLLQDRYDSVAHLASFERPLTLVVAGRDTVVPSPSGLALAQALGPRARVELLPKAGHNDWPEQVDAAWWRRNIDALLQQRR